MLFRREPLGNFSKLRVEAHSSGAFHLLHRGFGQCGLLQARHGANWGDFGECEVEGMVLFMWIPLKMCSFDGGRSQSQVSCRMN